jgi:protein TonB
MPRPPVVTLLASLVAHGGLLAIAFFLVSGESNPGVLFIDLEAVSESAAPIAATEPRPAAAGGDTKRASTGSARPARRDAERSEPAAASAPAPALPSPATPAAPPEPAREREAAPSSPQEPRPPAPAVAVVPAREAAPEVPARSEASLAPADPRTDLGGATGARTGPASEPDGGGRATSGSSSSTQGAGSPGAGGGTTVASGGPPGGAPGAEYGSYLATVRRRFLEALRYPPPARSRGLKGTVHLEIFIKSDGAIGNVSVADSSSHPLLDEAALEAARSLAPQPFPKGLAPRPLRVRLPVVFDLQ